jgi:hypothetical protein
MPGWTRKDSEGGQEDGDEANEHGGIEYEEFEDGEHEVHEHGELVYDDDELRKLKELKRMVNEEGHEPQGLDSRYEETQEPPQRAYELDHELGYSDDGASEHGDHEDGYGNTYPHPPPVSTARDDTTPARSRTTPHPHTSTPALSPSPPHPSPCVRYVQRESTRSRDHVGKPRLRAQRV